MRKKTKEEMIEFLTKELDRLNLYDEDFINKCKVYINLLINQVNEKGDVNINKTNLVKSYFDYFREIINVLSLILSICSLFLIPEIGIIKSLLIFSGFSAFEIINNDFIIKKDKEVKIKFNLLDNIAFKDYMGLIERNINKLVKYDNKINEDKIVNDNEDINKNYDNCDKLDFYEDYYLTDYEREFMNKSNFEDYGYYKNKVFKKVK